MIQSVGIDVGGTFTDLFVVDNGIEKHIKSPTTKEDPSIGVMNAIKKAGINLSDVENIVHGCTIATNAIIERTYDKTAFITTKGFRDVIEIGRYHREELYNPYQSKQSALVPRKYRYEINERIDSKGIIINNLDEEEARQIAKSIVKDGIKNVAVGFINSYMNEANELKMSRILKEADPEILVATSASVMPKIRLLGRFNLAIINAALQSLISKYIKKLEKTLKLNGFKGTLWLIQSNGGMIKVDQAVAHSEMFLLSGPAAGVAATCFITKNINVKNAVTMDMGGTSCDIAIVEDNQPVTTTSREIEFDIPVPIPMIDVTAIGAGGGSIAWVDNLGILKVGPQSAGANPGPAFYGSGKGHFTISDANLLLGYIHPKAFMSGELTVREEDSIAAAKEIGQKMGNKDPIKVAKGVITLANHNMSNALRETLVKKGRDPRDFTLIAFGGAGALHASAIARILKIPKIIIPIRSSVFCAFGATLLEPRHDFYETLYCETTKFNPKEVEKAFLRMQKLGEHILAQEGFKNIVLDRFAELRYVGQSYELEIPIEGEINGEILKKTFEDTHDRLYDVRIENNPVAVVSLHLRAVGIKKENEVPYVDNRKQPFIKGTRDVYFINEDGKIEAKIIDGLKLSRNDHFSGPAIVEYPTTTILVEKNSEAYVDFSGNIIIELK